MITIDQCRYVLALAHHLHFGRAAKELGITQPSLSIQVQKVEEMLGVIIFDRSKKPILITSIGGEVINHARRVIKEAEVLMKAGDQRKEINGKFKLAIIPTLSPYLLPTFLHSFARKYPGLQLEINELQTDEILKLLKEDRLDAGILITPLRDSEIVERVLFYEPLMLFLEKSHKFKLEKINLKDLDFNKLWLMEEGHCLTSQTLNLCKIKEENSVLSNVRFKGGSLEVLTNLVRKVGGFTVIPKLCAGSLSLKEKKEQLREFKDPTPVREVSIISSRIFYKEEIILKVQEEILNNLPKEITSLKKLKSKVIDL